MTVWPGAEGIAGGVLLFGPAILHLLSVSELRQYTAPRRSHRRRRPRLGR